MIWELVQTRRREITVRKMPTGKLMGNDRKTRKCRYGMYRKVDKDSHEADRGLCGQ